MFVIIITLIAVSRSAVELQNSEVIDIKTDHAYAQYLINPEKNDQFESNGFRLGLPVSFDWRNQNAITPIKDQGSNCADCWAFVAIAMVESYILRMFNVTTNLSEQFSLQCSGSDSKCSGGYVDKALTAIKNKKGVPLQSTYPYQGNQTYYNNSDICNKNNIYSVNIPSALVYTNMGDSDLKTLLVQQPLGIGIYASSSFNNYKSGVFSCLTTGRVNHAVLLIGWTAQGNYIIKNQFGTNWGENGYGVIDINANCSIGSAVYAMFQHSLVVTLALLVFLILA